MIAGNSTPRKESAKSLIFSSPESSSRPSTSNQTMSKQNKDVTAQLYSDRTNALTVKELHTQLRARLAVRGTSGINALGRSFRIADKDRSRSLDQNEFINCMHDFKIGLNKEDCLRLFEEVDADKSGTIDYEEYLYHIVGEMNDFRKKLAMQAFGMMDKDKSGILDISDIRGTYSAKCHPDFI